MYIQSIEKNKVDVKNNLRKIKKLTLLFLYEKKGKEKMLENYKEKKSLVIYLVERMKIMQWATLPKETRKSSPNT